MYVTHLECPKCELTYESEQPIQLCTCGAPLLVGYDLDRVRDSLSKEVLAFRKPTLWRYRELLPIRKDENILSLGDPMTPVLPLGRLGPEVGMPHLWMKDEGLLPTGTFKARGAAVGVSRARELGIKVLAMPTNGNAGAAMAAYCGRCLFCDRGQMNLCSQRLSYGVNVNGGFAASVVVRKGAIHRLPHNVDFVSGAMTEPLAVCVHALTERTQITAGQLVLVLGPGPVGLLAAMLAKAHGATVVVAGTTKDQGRREVARAVGADLTVTVDEVDLA